MDASQDAFFKIRPTKRSNPEERTTLDVIHQVHLRKIQSEHYEAIDLRQEINTLTQIMDSTNDDLVRGQLENQKVRLQEELREKEKPDRMLD